jgi:glycosyltransferase involved in cell wall biosynthesis
MPRVLIFKETLLPASETFILAQMHALRRYQPRLAGLEAVEGGLPLPQETLLLSRSSPGVVAALCAKLYRRTGIAPRFHAAARSFQPELVHAHFASGGRSALPLARTLQVPLIVTLHGSDVTVRRSSSDTYRRLAEEASLFLCVSQFIRQQALAAGFPEAKLMVHAIGIDRQAFSSATTTPPAQRVLFVGRLVEKKGCEYLLRASQIVQQRLPESELIVIGDGPLRPSLQGLAAALKLRCEFRGAQPAAAVRAALQSARVFCLPSVTAANGDSEGLPTVIAEAQAAGLPVVATRHAGIPEMVVDEQTGLLVAERNYQALAEALCTLLTDEPRWQSFRQAAQQRMEQHFDLTRQTALLEEIYSSVRARR